jgi:diguanylate cyclase (GGDEF)-like protein
MPALLVGTYSYKLVLLSALVAIIASYVALDMAARIVHARERAARWWLVGGASAMGFGIWSMHFIGMLAFELPIPQGYDLAKTAYSLLIACLASSYALWLVSQPRLPASTLALGAGLMGGGIATMHYVGMAAMEMQPGIDYSPGWFVLSIVIAVVASGTALWIAFRLREESRQTRRWRRVAAVIMGFAIVGMHYTGMAAADFPIGSLCGAAYDGGLPAPWLATLIGIATAAILGMALVVSVLDRRLAERTAVLAASLARANDELTYLALHDNLTQLPNRVLLSDRLRQALNKGQRSASRFAVLFMDLDGFKGVNDLYGHPTGDRLLREVADRIKGAVRTQDTVARLGGDEFVLLLEVADPEDAATVAEKIIELVRTSIWLNGAEIAISASVGIALYPEDGTSERDLLASADAAMYHAKEQGRNGYCFFEGSMNAGVHEQLALVQDLHHAIERNQLLLHYQPKFHAPHGPLMGAEALVRWHHPTRGTIPPEQFIPMAEKTGLIFEVGRWVLNEACRQLREWRDTGLALPGISVNLSALQFAAPGLFEMVRQALETHGLEPACLTLEITESTAMKDPESTLAILRQLSEFGVSISIDDFGTGYSSLMYLKRFPARELKIDRGFIRDLSAGTEDAAIISAIVALGRSLNIQVIAEGVETEDQRHVLTQLGCDSLQGYLLGHPVEARHFASVAAR